MILAYDALGAMRERSARDATECPFPIAPMIDGLLVSRTRGLVLSRGGPLGEAGQSVARDGREVTAPDIALAFAVGALRVSRPLAGETGYPFEAKAFGSILHKPLVPTR